MTKPPISKAHQRLNQIRCWLKSNAHYFRSTHLVLLRSVIEDVATPDHVETLQAYMREWKLPDDQAEAQKATMDKRIHRAEMERAAWFAAREEAERQGVPGPPYPLPETQDRAASPWPLDTPEHSPAPSAKERISPVTSQAEHTHHSVF